MVQETGPSSPGQNFSQQGDIVSVREQSLGNAYKLGASILGTSKDRVWKKMSAKDKMIDSFTFLQCKPYKANDHCLIIYHLKAGERIHVDKGDQKKKKKEVNTMLLQWTKYTLWCHHHHHQKGELMGDSPCGESETVEGRTGDLYPQRPDLTWPHMLDGERNQKHKISYSIKYPTGNGEPYGRPLIWEILGASTAFAGKNDGSTWRPS